MGDPTRGTSSRFTSRFQVQLAMLVGVVILGGVAVSAEGPPRKKATRKPAITKGFEVPSIRKGEQDVVGRPYLVVIPNTSASGEDLEFQKGIARVLSHQAGSYPGREEHFNWLVNDAVFQNAVHKVHGLSGYILEAEALPGGGWRARMSVRPSVAAIGVPVIEDHVLEDYRYQDGVLTLVQTDAAVPKPDKQILRLH